MNKKICFSLNLILLFSAIGFCDSKGVGTTGISILRLGVGTRSSGLGNAATSIDHNGISESFQNAASLVGIQKQEISFVRLQHILDISSNYFGYARPINLKSAFGIAGFYSSYGQIDETTVSVGNDEGIKTGNSIGASDFSTIATYSQMINKYLSFGTNLKYIRETLSGTNAQTYSVDFGGLYQFSHPQMNIGFAMRNLGPNFHFDQEDTSLPFSFAFGVSSYFLKRMILVSVDLEKPDKMNWVERVGMEFNLLKQLSVRTGFNGIGDFGGISFGFGYYVGQYNFNYSLVPYGTLGQSHRISIAYRFGKNISDIIQNEAANKKPEPLIEETTEHVVISVDQKKNPSPFESTEEKEVITPEQKLESDLKTAEKYFAIEVYDKAYYFVSKVLKVDPENKRAKKIVNDIMKMQNVEKAKELYDKVLEVKSLSRYQDAMELIKRCLVLDPENIIYKSENDKIRVIIDQQQGSADHEKK